MIVNLSSRRRRCRVRQLADYFSDFCGFSSSFSTRFNLHLHFGLSHLWTWRIVLVNNRAVSSQSDLDSYFRFLFIHCHSFFNWTEAILSDLERDRAFDFWLGRLAGKFGADWLICFYIDRITNPNGNVVTGEFDWVPWWIILSLFVDCCKDEPDSWRM